MLCMIHCVIAPLLLTPFLFGKLIPESSLDVLHAYNVHDTMLVFTLTFGISSVYLSARRGNVMAVVCLALGLVAVATAEFLMHDSVTVRVPGTLCILGGHLWAMRSRHARCEH